MTRDEQALLERRAGKDTVKLIQLSEQARDNKQQLAVAHENYEAQLNAMESHITALQTTGVEKAATATAIGIGLGGGAAYLLHDTVAEYFGRGSLPALLLLPGVGAFVFWRTPKWFKDKKATVREKAESRADTRATSYGAGFGLILVGGYLSYEDYVAANPPAP